jgi:hypothetical protein
MKYDLSDSKWYIMIIQGQKLVLQKSFNDTRDMVYCGLNVASVKTNVVMQANKVNQICFVVI